MKVNNCECIYFVLNGHEDEEMLKHTLIENVPDTTDVYYLCLDKDKPHVPVPVPVIICATEKDMEVVKMRLKEAYYGSSK